MRPFIGTYENRVDRKGRVSVPAKFRAVLQAEGYDGIVVRPDIKNGCIEGYGQDRLERLSDSTPDILDVDDPDTEQTYQILADSEDLGWDPTGRVLIPSNLLEAAGITEQAVFVGLGRVFQIWNPEAHAAFRAQKLRGGTKPKGGA